MRSSPAEATSSNARPLNGRHPALDVKLDAEEERTHDSVRELRDLTGQLPDGPDNRTALGRLLMQR